MVGVKEGYSGSSNDHYYRSAGATVEASRLFWRERACGCRPCLKLEDGCLLTPANTETKAGKTPRGWTVTLEPKRQTLASRHTRGARNPLPEFCQELKVGQNIIVRVSNDEKDDNPDEEVDDKSNESDQRHHLTAPPRAASNPM